MSICTKFIQCLRYFNCIYIDEEEENNSNIHNYTLSNTKKITGNEEELLLALNNNSKDKEVFFKLHLMSDSNKFVSVKLYIDDINDDTTKIHNQNSFITYSNNNSSTSRPNDIQILSYQIPPNGSIDSDLKIPLCSGKRLTITASKQSNKYTNVGISCMWLETKNFDWNSKQKNNVLQM